jgi:iron complex outermembrane receptor protein
MVFVSSFPAFAEDDLRAADAANSQETTSVTKEPRIRFHEVIQVVGRPVIEQTRLSSLGSEIMSVGARQIEDLHAQDFASALRRVPGVVISRYNLIGSYGGGDGGAIYMRGHGSGRPGAAIQTMVDGIPRFVSVWTHPLLDTLDVDAAERLDVYRSAQPVLWGNMAFGGVDIVSRRRAEAGHETRLTGSFGSFDSVVGRLAHGGRAGRFDYYVTASHRQSEGERENSGGRVDALYARLGVVLSRDWNASLSLHGNDAWADDPGPTDAAPTPEIPRFAVTDALTVFTLEHAHARANGYAKLYFHDGSIDWRQWDADKKEGFSSLTDYRRYGLKLQERLTPWKNGELTLGYDRDVYGGAFTEDRPHQDYVFPTRRFRDDGPYVALSQRFGSRERVEIVPSAGLRLTLSRDFGEHVGAQGGLVVRHRGMELHANAAHAFNLPGVYAAVSYGQWNQDDAWKDLHPEQLTHIELGFSQSIGSTTRIGATVFYDDVDDALRFVAPPPPPPSYANVGSYVARGAEITASVSPCPNVSLFGAVAHMDTSPVDVPNAPAWTWTGGASWAPTARLRLNADMERISERTVLNPRFARQQALVGTTFLVNARVGYRPRFAESMSGELFVAAENLTDSDYEYRPGYPMPGRTVFVGFGLAR